jgi:hypothetical protein
MIVAFIVAMVGEGFAVELISAVLTAVGCRVAARTYRSWKQPARPVAARTVSDAVVIERAARHHRHAGGPVWPAED